MDRDIGWNGGLGVDWRAAVIGCGARQRHGDEGFAIGHVHGRAYRGLPDVALVGACDVDPCNLSHFVEAFDVPHPYTDYREMLSRQRLDVVSVCVPVGLHAEIVIACAKAGVRAILCEKPLALGLGDVDRMLDACAAAGTQLALNTQRRFGARWRAAHALVESGAIGRLLRFEGSCPEWDLMEWGTHWVDMSRFFAGEAPAEWVFAQVDGGTRRRRYGHLVEDDALVQVGYANGVQGVLFMGAHAPTSPANRIVGSEGMIEIDGAAGTRFFGPETGGWRLVPVPDGGPDPFETSLRLLLDAAASGRQPPHGAASARAVTEVVMAAYESAAQGRLIRLPLHARDFPLARVVARYGEA